MENGNVPGENPEDPQQGQEQQPPPQPPPPEPESVETVFLSPFSMPGESGGAGLLAMLLWVPLEPCLGLPDGGPDPGVEESWYRGPTLSHQGALRHWISELSVVQGRAS